MKITGTMLAPGVSANGRYYSPAMIAAAVAQAQPRIAAGRFVLKAEHSSADTLGVVGAVRSLWVAEDGSAKFEGELADTSTARDVKALIRGRKPFVDGVSIEGQWVGKPRRVQVGGAPAETADGVVLDALAFTRKPGVDSARIKVAESMGGRFIVEQAPGPVEPVAPELTARDYAGMTTEEFDVAAGEIWAGHFAAVDERRRNAGPSPFWRGLTR